MEDVVSIKRLILKKLVNSNMWGGKHTPLDFVLKGLPEQIRIRPAGQRAIDKALKELQNDVWIIINKKRTGSSYEDHISLNQEKVSEIQQFLSEQ
jgi:predicted nucleotidyltransferase